MESSGLTWNEKFELPDGSAIQDYFYYIIKKYGKVTDNPPIRIYGTKIENNLHLESRHGNISNF